MRGALLIVSALGIAIGLSLPGARHAPTAAAVAAAEPAEHPVDTVIERSDRGHFLTVAEVNREPIRFVVDTGADIVALTTDDARRAHVDFDPAQFTIVGHGAGGEVRGQEVRIASIVLDGKRATDVRGVVLEGGEVSLLGQTYLRHLGSVQIADDRMTLR